MMMRKMQLEPESILLLTSEAQVNSNHLSINFSQLASPDRDAVENELGSRAARSSQIH